MTDSPEDPWANIDNVVPFERQPHYLDEADDAVYGAMSRDEEIGELPGVVDIATWVDREAPHRRWIIPGWIVRGASGLLSGQEGVGKSLLAQQMATCAATGRNFLGLDIAHVKAVYITCEDPQDELWRRQEAINKALGIPMRELAGQLLLVSLKGQLGNELGTFDQAGRLTPSARFKQIRKLVLEFGANLTILDNAAHLFPGNENARHDVAAFLGLTESLSEETDGAVIMLAHPNKQHAQGNTQGNEFSGSTGWSAHVRNRLFLDWAKEDQDGNPLDEDGRLLRKSKANYGKKGEEITFRWHEWAFSTMDSLPPDTAREIAANAQANHENERFLACLEKALQERRNTSASTAASNYAPRVFSKMTACGGMKMEALESAMNRLLHLGVIRGEQKLWQRPNRTWVLGLGLATEGCTNPRTNHAQNAAQSVHEAAQSYSTGVHSPVGPHNYVMGGAPEGGSPTTRSADPPDWMDEAPPFDPGDWRENPLLNPDRK